MLKLFLYIVSLLTTFPHYVNIKCDLSGITFPSKLIQNKLVIYKLYFWETGRPGSDLRNGTAERS